MRRVTRGTTFCLNRSVLKRERTLLVGVALNTRGVGARCQSRLFKFKPAVRIRPVAATQRAFQHLGMKRHAERWLYLGMTTRAELRVIGFQHANSREARLLGICRGDKSVRAGVVSAARVRGRRGAISG